ncbi:DUF4405 domain-containing protein [Clostridium sp. Mt-5]|uniref:DUF4405 domain-containing protein n=2 Tax=Clostridium moutaii TaxID=3240932 RepID=A0ABV4BVD7_9CLOT
MIALMISGIILSRYVFAFLSISGGMPFARTMHIVASYWGFVLMSMHMGLHWGMIIEITCKLTKKKKLLKVSIWILRAAAAAIAVYGAICFYKENIVSYMFLKNQFAFFDFEQSSVSVFAENIAMMGLWTFVAYYAAKLIQKPLYKKRRQNAL